jgi:hypothetical protein
MKLSAGMEMVGRGWLARRSNEIVSKPVRQAPNFPPFDSLEDARAFKRQKVVNSVTASIFHCILPWMQLVSLN